jgi:hypothetical protein
MRARVRAAGLVAGVLVGVLGPIETRAASAATVPSVTIDDNPTVVEGDPGASVSLVFTVRLSAPTATPVSGRFFTEAFAPSDTAATAGPTCSSAGADFITKDVPFVIPSNVSTIAIPVTVCPDNTAERASVESMVALVQELANAVCFEGTCIEIGRIVDDDSAPLVSVNDVTVSEPFSGAKTATFTVTLNHPHTGVTVVADLRTRDGTARTQPSACGTAGTNNVFPDYRAVTSRLTFPSGVQSATFGVSVCADSIDEPSQGYFVDVIPVSNARAGSIGRGTILDRPRITAPTTGTFSLSPADLDVQVGEHATYMFAWTVSDGVWRDLTTLDLRVRRRPHGETVLWVRWDETTNLLSLCHGPTDNPRCGIGATPGSNEVLSAPHAHLYLAESRVDGSGPTGASVALTLRVSFDNGAPDSSDVEAAAADDFGNRDAFVAAGTLRVARPSREGSSPR